MYPHVHRGKQRKQLFPAFNDFTQLIRRRDYIVYEHVVHDSLKSARQLLLHAFCMMLHGGYCYKGAAHESKQMSCRLEYSERVLRLLSIKKAQKGTIILIDQDTQKHCLDVTVERN